MPIFLSYSTALLLGSLHALEADHMAAVTSFAVRRPGWRRAVRFGVRWAAGHGAAILLVGAGLILLGLNLPDGATHWLERLVGVVMIGLGLWTLSGARQLHVHERSQEHAYAAGAAGRVHTQVHAHEHGAAHTRHDTRPHAHAGEHGHTATAVGMVHGLAGSGSAVALIPVVGFDSPAAAILYLLVFAVGTVAGMMFWGLLAGAFVGRAAQRSVTLARALARGTGAITIVIGLIWLVR